MAEIARRDRENCKKKVTLTHTPTGTKCILTLAEQSCLTPSDAMVTYNNTIANQTLVITSLPTPEADAIAAAACINLLDGPSLTAEGVKWVSRGANGNELHVGDVSMYGYDKYAFSTAEKLSNKQQPNSTLMITTEGFEALRKRRDELAAAGVRLATLPPDRSMAAFISGAVHLLEKMVAAASGRFVDAHFVNSANKAGAFKWHIDDHAEQSGRAYIDTSIVGQLSPGEASLLVAGFGEIDYNNGFVKFPGWAIHRTGKVDPPHGASMWKLAGFFEPAVDASPPGNEEGRVAVLSAAVSPVAAPPEDASITACGDVGDALDGVAAEAVQPGRQPGVIDVIDLSQFKVVVCPGGGDCGPHAYLGNVHRNEAHALRRRLKDAYGRKQYDPVTLADGTAYDTWEAYVMDCAKTAKGFNEGSTFTEYLSFIDAPTRAAARGNFFGAAEWEMLAHLDSKWIVLVDAQGVPQSAHGDPTHDRLLMRYSPGHYDGLQRAWVSAPMNAVDGSGGGGASEGDDPTAVASCARGAVANVLASFAAAAAEAAVSSVAAPPEDASITACGDVGDALDSVAAEAGRAEMETGRTAWRWRNGVAYAPSERVRGALAALSRTGEGYKLPCGTWQTCLVDATFNGIMTLAPSVKPSLPRLIAKAVPALGNARQASWASVKAALSALQYPMALVEATARFMAPGGPMLNMLRTEYAVLVVGLHVRIDGTAYQHCVMLSTLPEPHAPYGKLVDNHGHMRPVYLEAKDLASRPAAARAFRELIAQNPVARDCNELTVEPSDVYELVAAGVAGVKRRAEVAPGAPRKAPRPGERVCVACACALPTEAFSKTQRAKGPSGRCIGCVGRE